MKRVLLIAAVLLISAMAFVGCKKDKSQGGSDLPAPYFVDLSKVTLYSVENDQLVAPIGNFVKNQAPLTKDWEDMMLILPKDMPDLTVHNRITIFGRFFDIDNDEIDPTYSLAMLSMLYDTNQNWRADTGPNTVFKEFNFMAEAMVSQPSGKGLRVSLSANPQALLLQRNAGSDAAYIEITSIIFHSGNFKVEGADDEDDE